MPSSVTEEDVLKLREARFLTGEIWHRLPAQGQVIPTPKPGESVVFMSHFLRGLGFPTDPFVRGLMYYYGLEFHDLAPESILHISSFIVMCEAFLRITPHFGLWLKTFKVEPKMIEGRHAECGGAFISKNAGAPWPEGSFQGESSLWQQEWFYITAPRSTKWVAQVMLIRRVLPCKRRPLRLWEFNPEGPRVLQHFLGMTPVEMYKLFFGPQVVCPDSTEDAGLSCNRPDTQVSSLVPGLAIRIFIIKLPLKELSFKQEWIAKAKLIRCPPPSPRPRRVPCYLGCWRLCLQREVREGTRELQPPQRRLSGREESKIPLLRGRRGPPLKTRRP